jgi:hypothetical protein
MNPEPKNRWIIVTPTICQGDIPAYWDEDDKPVTYATQREAWKEIADTQIMKLQEFIDDETRDDDEVPEFEPEDYIIPCDVHPDGVIATETHGVFFDPTEPASKYGR